MTNTRKEESSRYAVLKAPPQPKIHTTHLHAYWPYGLWKYLNWTYGKTGILHRLMYHLALVVALVFLIGVVQILCYFVLFALIDPHYCSSSSYFQKEYFHLITVF